MKCAHIFVIVCVLHACRVRSKSASYNFDEPMCSKFHFEEHVLEKLVRFEINTEQSFKQEQDELSNLRTEFSDLKKELAALRTAHSQEVTDRSLKDTEVEEKMNALSQRSSKTKSVAFVARNPPTSLPTNVPVRFSTTVLNSGDCYDSSTGIYTAPVTGTFLFSTQLCSINDVRFQLIVNNEVLGVSRQYEPDTSGICSSMVTVATMNSGEQAWV